MEGGHHESLGRRHEGGWRAFIYDELHAGGNKLTTVGAKHHTPGTAEADGCRSFPGGACRDPSGWMGSLFLTAAAPPLRTNASKMQISHGQC